MSAPVGSLLSLLDKGKIDCLNENESHPVQNALNGAFTFVESDCDDQLLIRLGFTVPVRVQHIVVVGDEDPDSHPLSVRVFKNRPHLDFDDATDAEPDHEAELSAANLSSKQKIQLRFAKMQNVTSIQIFFPASAGGQISRVRQLDVCGSPADSSDISQWKPAG